MLCSKSSFHVCTCCVLNSYFACCDADELVALHQGQGMDIFWRDHNKCPTEADYTYMVLNSTFPVRCHSFLLTPVPVTASVVPSLLLWFLTKSLQSFRSCGFNMHGMSLCRKCLNSTLSTDRHSISNYYH